MRFFHTAVLAALASVSAALPGLEERATSCLNNCFKSLFSAHPLASSDCASFFRATIEPCPTTFTVDTTRTVTARPQTITSTATVTTYTTDITTRVLSEKEVELTVTEVTDATTTETATVTESTYTAFTIDTASTSITTTQTFTVTVTTTTYVDDTPQTQEVEKRAACTAASTIVASRLPAFASSCGATAGNGVYASACSCYGATHTRTTLPPSTVTTTVSLVKTVTPVTTFYVTRTVAGGTQYVTVYSTTSTATTTTSTASVTATVDITTTATDTVTFYTTIQYVITADSVTTATVTTTDPACPITQVSGPSPGEYLYANTGESDIMDFTSDISQAGYFWLDGQSQLSDVNGNLLAPDDTEGYVQDGPNSSESDYYPLTCTTDSNQVLSCLSSGPVQRNNIFITNGSLLVFGDQDDNGDGSVQVTFAFDC